MRELDSPWHLAEGVQATVAHQLAGGEVVQLWRAGPEPHLQSWYQPAAVFCHELRSVDDLGGSGPIDLDDLLFVGRIDEPGGRSLFVYRHRGPGGEVLLDAEGAPHAPVDDPRRRAGHRFDPLDPVSALAALLPPVRPAHPTAPGERFDTGDGAVVLPFRRRGVELEGDF